jgi:uncharacterized protein with FMN-binding domain
MRGRVRAGRGPRFAALAALCLPLALLAFSCAMRTPITIDSVDFSRVRDGTFRGTYETTLVKAEMEAVMAAGKMTGLTVIRHECGLGKPAEAIVDRVLVAQSLEVDAVSGATGSSRVILKATEIALKQGLTD